MLRTALRCLLWIVLAGLMLQVYFVGRIALMRWVNPQSTAFERSEIWQGLTGGEQGFRWRQQWADYSEISDHLKRAVIASEDGDFAYHDGVEWEAIERAMQRNARSEQQAERRRQRSGKPIAPKVVGGSTITQQLAKNLFLSGERTYLRKAQEIVLTYALEALLPKERILEIYLNSVEWGEGIFGAQAAAQHYFKKNAARLTAHESARLAVMLPRPKFFEKTPNSPYLASRAQTILVRMGDAELP